MQTGIGAWFESRLHIEGPMKKLLFKELHGGARYIFSFGSLNLFLFINQMLTGMFLMVYYVPSPDHAYDAVKFIQNDVTFGYIVRGLHFWGASAMIVSLFLHAARVYLWGAYKKPREIMWISGVLLLLFVYGFAFTGYLLPWDQKAYWATVVGTNVPGTVPVFGPIIARLLRGGPDVTNLTLTRFFTLHTEVLPWLLAMVAGLHLTVLQLAGHTPHWDSEKSEVASPFYPDQVFKDMVAALFVFALLIFLATSFRPGLEALADPSDKTYNPRPEWYFYFLFQLLHYTEGKFEIFGTFILPNTFVALLLALPFIDRNPERNPKKRPVAIAALGFVLMAYLALTLLAAPPAPKEAKVTAAATATEGRKLYSSLGCASCHSINGVGGRIGPPLDSVGMRRNRAWLIAHFRDPQRLTPGSIMPKYDTLTDQQLDFLTDYILSLR